METKSNKMGIWRTQVQHQQSRHRSQSQKKLLPSLQWDLHQPSRMFRNSKGAWRHSTDSSPNLENENSPSSSYTKDRKIPVGRRNQCSPRRSQTPPGIASNPHSTNRGRKTALVHCCNNSCGQHYNCRGASSAGPCLSGAKAHLLCQ